MTALAILAELEELDRFLTASAARAEFGDHVCMAAQPETVNGSPEVLVDDGVRAGAEICGGWADTIVASLEGKGSEFEIRSALQHAATSLDVTAFAKQAEELILRSLMLGALDSVWERENDQEIAPAKFAATPPDRQFVYAPFAKAVEQFEQRQVLPPAAFKALEEGARRRAFTVAGLAKQELLDATHAELLRQLREAHHEDNRGSNLRDFQKFAKERLESAGWTPKSPSHVECLPGETPVTGAVVRAAHRRWYEGPLVEVVTAAGRKFSTTPNHPMLTRLGWRGTGELREGDDLVGYRGQKDSVPSRNDDVAAPPASIAQVFSACSEVGNTERIHGVDRDFHGDGAHGDVDIASPAGMLRTGIFAALRKPLEQLLFTPAKLATPRFCRECGHLVVVTQRCGFCDRPVSDAGLSEHPSDRVVAGAQFLSETVAALASRIASGNLLLRQILTLARRGSAAREMQSARLAQGAGFTGSFDHLSDPLGRRSDDGSDALSAKAADIEFDRVVSLRIFEFRGHVYNLSTQHGYFTIAGLFTGNTIYRTNMVSAYSSGRVVEMTQPSVLAALPYWQIRTVKDARQRPTHRAADGVVLPANHPFWRIAYPPFGFNCRCRVCARTKRWLEQNGVAIGSPPPNLPDPGFESGTRALITVPASALEPPRRPAPVVAPQPAARPSPFQPALPFPTLPVALPSPLQGPPAPGFAIPPPPLPRPKQAMFEARNINFGSAERYDKAQAAAEKLFGKPIDVHTIDRVMGANHVPGLRSTSIYSEGETSLSVHSVYRTSAGETTVISRKFRLGRDGKPEVYHALFEIDEKLQGRGIAKAVLRDQLLEYQRLGIKRVQLTAAWTGRYTWTRMGFEFTGDQAMFLTVRSAFRKHLTGVLGKKVADKIILHVGDLRQLALTEVAGQKLGKDFLSKHLSQGMMLPMRLNLDPSDPSFKLVAHYLGI